MFLRPSTQSLKKASPTNPQSPARNYIFLVLISSLILEIKSSIFTEPRSPAARAGLKAGDVITSIDGKPVENGAELRRRLREREGEEVAVGIVRDRQASSIKVRIERPERTVTSRRWTV
ncbi:MAG: PDZ domain-containing protein [Firmicutes bacterium]|nr:PDZ domain-containing protein [Bacillota bacterium]